tara:strand:- start:162 stop:527 length:366 start_codon:yes stop_codon:yes gene_type:complete
MVAAGIVSGIIFAWFVTNVVAMPQQSVVEATSEPPQQDPPQDPNNSMEVETFQEALTDMNVRKNSRNVKIYDVAENTPHKKHRMVQHVGELQTAQAMRMRDGAKLDPDGMPYISRPVVIRS